MTPLLVFLTYGLYSALIALVVWAALVPLHLLQITRRRATWRDLHERLGAVQLPGRSGRRRLVIHAVSGGEAAAAGAFVAALDRERPEWSVVFACGTRDARLVAATLQQQFASIEAVIALPWDRAATIVRWLRRLDPQALVVVEPEIWPNLFRACNVTGVPLFLINAHVYAGDVPRYRLLRRFFADVLRRPVWIAAQGEGDRDDLLAIGAPAASTFVGGSLKFDTVVHPTPSSLVDSVRASCSERPVIIGGSTYAAEEACLFDALDTLRARFPTLRLIVAPRHVRRAAEVAATAVARGFRVGRASTILPAEAWDVLVVDRFGELASLYAVGDIALVGGTVTPRGGHNVLEPARHGCVVIVGPHVQQIRDAVLDLESAGGIVHLQDCTPAAFVEAAGRLLSDPSRRRVIGERAQAYHAAHAGAATRCARGVIAEVERRAEQGLSAPGPSRATREKWPLGASEAES